MYFQSLCLLLPFLKEESYLFIHQKFTLLDNISGNFVSFHICVLANKCLKLLLQSAAAMCLDGTFENKENKAVKHKMFDGDL